MEFLAYDTIKNMPVPLRDIPNYEKLARDFADYVFDPLNGIMHTSPDGKIYFNAYAEGHGNEMVTWGILAVGNILTSASADLHHWIWDSAFKTYFHPEYKIYTNTPGSTNSEFWYMLYVNNLAGAVYRAIFSDCHKTRDRMLASAKTLQKIAQEIDYDFNHQGYDLVTAKAWSNKDIYRQPDTIGGYAYNMLFAGIHSSDGALVNEAAKAMAKYEAFTNNPWYEIPNGGTAVLAAAWLKSKGHDVNLEKILGYIFDTKEGPLQTGNWNNQPVDGLLMGWRGDDREYAKSSVYSMESLMPLPFMLPATKYAPEMAKSIAWYALNAVANFGLFYGTGVNGTIHETRPDLSATIPYEKVEKERDGHSPVACGDFMGHRSVYGGGYLMWISEIMRHTSCKHMPAWDISLSDWLETGVQSPKFLLYNREKGERRGVFTPSTAWHKKRPDLYPGGVLSGKLRNMLTSEIIGHVQQDGYIDIAVPADGILFIEILLPA